MSPIDMFKEVNTGSNLPAQVDIYAVKGNEYKFMFIAKGGGSANKTFLYQKTKVCYWDLAMSLLFYVSRFIHNSTNCSICSYLLCVCYII